MKSIAILPVCPPDAVQSTAQKDVALIVYVPRCEYVWPQSGDDFPPSPGPNTDPAVVHVTAWPSPICHTTRFTFAVADTVTPRSLKLRVCGPNVCGDGVSTHIHTGRPTVPTTPGRSSGAIPTSIDRKFICATNCFANTAGSGGAATPAGCVADQKE